MSRTLADMTEQERAACVGMWCEISGRSLAVLADIWEHGEGGVVHSNADLSCYDFTELAPRYDLPRAWTPDGEPVEMHEEFGEVAQGRAWLDGTHNTGLTHLPAGPIRRYVSDWEEA